MEIVNLLSQVEEVAGKIRDIEPKDLARIRNRVAHTYRRLNPNELKFYGNEAASSKDLTLTLIGKIRERSIDPPKPSRP